MHKKLVYIIGSIANIFECYEFSVYAYLAGIIATQFFPHGNFQTNLIKVFLIFAVSYFIKPIGGIFWGYIGDYCSKATVMRWSLVMMAIPTFLLGLLPTYQQIGTLSSVLLLILRLLQGFAMGGELPGSACYLYELSEKKDRRFHCSFVSASSMLGMFLGASLVTILNLLLNDQQMHAWGWRLPFFIGLPLAVFIYYFRQNIVNAANDTSNKVDHNICEIENKNTGTNTTQATRGKLVHFTSLFKHHLLSLLTVITLNGFIVVSYYLLFLWMPTYMIYYIKIPESSARLSTSVNLIILILFTLLAGRFLNFFSRKTMLLISLTSMSILIYPLFLLLNQPSGFSIYFTQFLFAITLAFAKGVGMETMVSLFSNKIRCLGVSLSFSVSLTLFGSMTPSLASYLIEKFNSNLAPILIIISATLLALPFVLLLKQSKTCGQH